MTDYTPDIAIHPGETLKEAMEDKRLNVFLLSGILGVHENCLQDFMDGKIPLTDQMAERLGDFVSTKQFWLNLQKQYDRLIALGIQPAQPPTN